MLEIHGIFVDLNWLPKLMFMIIILGLGLILLAAENKERNSNELDQNLKEDSEQQQLMDHHTERSLEENDESGDRTATPAGFLAYDGCSFCGKLCKTLRCSRCKAARYCSAECNSIHWRLWHKYECDEVKTAAVEGRLASPNSKPQNESSRRRLEVDYYNEEGGRPSNDKSGDGSTAPVSVSDYDGCGVSDNRSTKNRSICKVNKYCSAECQNRDWPSRHEVQSIGEKANSTQIAGTRQARPSNENENNRHFHGHNLLQDWALHSSGTTSCEKIETRKNSYGEEDNIHSSGPLSSKIFPEEVTTNSAPLIGSSQLQELPEATGKATKETEEQERLRSLKRELEKSRIENASLQSERDNWEKRAKFAANRLLRIMKESEHKLFSLKHEKETMSNAEEQARHMVQSLSEKLHRLKIEGEVRAAEKKRQEEYIQILQNECNKAKRELQTERECIQMLTMEHDKATRFAIKQAEETRRKLVNALRMAAAAEVVQTDSRSRDFNFLCRQVCTICLNNEKDLAFGCGHMTCRDCGSKLSKCPICREKITSRVKLFPG